MILDSEEFKKLLGLRIKGKETGWENILQVSKKYQPFSHTYLPKITQNTLTYAVGKKISKWKKGMNIFRLKICVKLKPEEEISD